MNKIFPLINLFLFCCLLRSKAYAQTSEKLLANISTLEQANKFIISHPKDNTKLFTISTDKDTSDITLPLFQKQVGYIFRIDNNVYKIIQAKSYPEFKVNYIFLNGNQLSIHEIDSIRNIIITRFKTGTYFYDLAKEYSMDDNPSGNLDWFTENMMVKEFEIAVKKHKKYDIFTVDVPDKNWYYVVFKTFDDRLTKRLTLISIKDGK